MKRKKYFFLIPILFILLFSFIVLYIQKDRLYFRHFIKEYVSSQLEMNSLNLHYTVQDPKTYGIENKVCLPSYTANDTLYSYESLLEDLEKTDVSSLSSDSAFTYYVLSDYLKENLALEKYPYYTEPLTPNSGVHTTLPILLAEYDFSKKSDIENYLLLLAEVPDYLSSVISYETQKAGAGFFMNSHSLQKVVAACEEFSSCSDISEHFLYVSFSERLFEFSQNGGNLTDEEITAYIKQNASLLTDTVFPAYGMMAEKLTDLSLYCDDTYHGLCTYEDGKEYYQALIKRNTGSYRSMTDIKELLFSDFENAYNSLLSLLAQNPTLLEDDFLDNFYTSFPISSANEMLSHLQKSMESDFPSLNAEVNVEIKTLSESLADYCSPAFYLTVPVDDYTENVIYLNPKSKSLGLDLYTTLAHEGYPGHLYQTVFFHVANDLSANKYETLLRNIIYYGGYTEGYALYTEWLSYDYAAQLCQDANMENAAYICDICKYEWQMQISLYCLLDIAIHYDGASFTQVKALLNKFGITEDASVENVYQYLLAEPTTYLKYYLGFLEIKDLKNKAMLLWGENYTDKDFHSFLLKTGPASFMRLQEKLMEG